jgi:predicted CxxxxCH...CXXCH cytochrome family protein
LPHTIHVNTYGVTGGNTNINCEVCHTGTAVSNIALQATTAARDQHPDTQKNVAFGTFTGGNWSGTQCSNTYCHSSGTSTSGTHANMFWSGTMDTECDSCHGGNSTATTTTGTGKITTNAHAAHIDDSSNQVGFNVGCQVCHGATVSADRTLLSSKANHVNKVLNIRFDNGALIKDADLPTYNNLDAKSAGSGATRTPGGTPASCGTVYCHSIGNLDGTGAVITAGSANFRTVAWNTTIAGCDDCHGDQAGKAHPTYTSGTAGTTTANSHATHIDTMAYSCDICHISTTTSTSIPPTTVIASGLHLNRAENVNFNTATAGTGATWVAASKTCSNTSCHGGSTVWGDNTTSSTPCVECHGVAGTTPAQYTSTPALAAPGTNNTGVDTAGTAPNLTRYVSLDTEIGAHDGHLAGRNNISDPITCNQCHTVPANTPAGIKGHLDGGNADMTWGSLATTGAAPASFDSGTHTCSTVYCHNPEPYIGSQHTNGGTDTTPTWNDQSFFANSPVTTTECGKCHYYSASVNCSSCHYSATAGDFVTAGNGPTTFANKALHIDGTITAQGGDCISCHNDAKGSRRAMSTELTNLAWSHKKTASGSWTKYDCGVCHMEGDPVSGNPVTPYHSSTSGNGILEFRDPDTGLTIKAVTFTGTPGSYTSTTTDATSATFARNTGSNTLESFAQAVMINLCVKCHDGGTQGGAYSTAARVSGGTASQPFGTSAGTVRDVKAHFATTNSSYHPVLGKNNNSYADGTTMVSPWNGITKTDGSTATYGDLITCWDCHDSSAAGRTIGGTTASVTAHGSSTQFRGNTWTSPATLCTVCHLDTTYSKSGGVHSSGSAFAVPIISNMKPNTTNCQYCHASAYTKPDRQTSAADVHGFNALATGGNWPGSNYASRPYAFIRNTEMFLNHRPKQSPEKTNTNGACNLRNGATCSHNNMPTTANDASATYTPGGVY